MIRAAKLTKPPCQIYNKTYKEFEKPKLNTKTENNMFRKLKKTPNTLLKLKIIKEGECQRERERDHPYHNFKTNIHPYIQNIKIKMISIS